LTLKKIGAEIILEVRDKVREVDIQARQVKASNSTLKPKRKIMQLKRALCSRPGFNARYA